MAVASRSRFSFTLSLSLSRARARLSREVTRSSRTLGRTWLWGVATGFRILMACASVLPLLGLVNERGNEGPSAHAHRPVLRMALCTPGPILSFSSFRRLSERTPTSVARDLGRGRGVSSFFILPSSFSFLHPTTTTTSTAQRASRRRRAHDRVLVSCS